MDRANRNNAGKHSITRVLMATLMFVAVLTPVYFLAGRHVSLESPIGIRQPRIVSSARDPTRSALQEEGNAPPDTTEEGTTNDDIMAAPRQQRWRRSSISRRQDREEEEVDVSKSESETVDDNAEQLPPIPKEEQVIMETIAAENAWFVPSQKRFGGQRRLSVEDDWLNGSPLFIERMRAYRLQHQLAVDPKSSIPDNERRFLVYVATNDGLGNKILPFVSCFLYALLTNRVFLVDWTGRDPFQGGSVVWDRNPGAVSEFLESPFGAEWQYEFVKDALQSFNIHEGHTFLDLRTPDYSDLKLRLLCRPLVEAFGGARVVRIASDQYILPLAASNTHHSDVVMSWLRPGNIYGPLARQLLKPVPWVADMVTSVRSKFGDYTIGLQMRRKEGIGLRDHEITTVWECASHLREVYGPPGDRRNSTARVKFLVASDDIGTRQRAREVFGADSVITFDHTTDRNSIEGVRWALAESMLLASCDDIISTPHSTFGYMSHALGSIVPHHVGNSPDVHCFKLLNSDPHAHFWGPLFNEKNLRPNIADSYCKSDDPKFFQLEGPPRWA